jgi:hypothetical protein
VGISKCDSGRRDLPRLCPRQNEGRSFLVDAFHLERRYESRIESTNLVFCIRLSTSQARNTRSAYGSIDTLGKSVAAGPFPQNFYSYDPYEEELKKTEREWSGDGTGMERDVQAEWTVDLPSKPLQFSIFLRIML